MPEVIDRIPELRVRLATARSNSIGLVPTMGALHRGHAKLLDAARRENAFVVATIFVNPIQFDRREDLENYPRTMEDDLRMCDRAGVDLVFAPSPAELYPREQLTFVESPALESHLCGPHRPGHFRGVATVVLKLLNIVQPGRTYFGREGRAAVGDHPPHGERSQCPCHSRASPDGSGRGWPGSQFAQ